ncbi:MAG: HEAT repeat domain-containing protein [Myxococcota bacterium]
MIGPWILLFADPAAAGELREPVLELLSAYEQGASAEDLRKLGEGVPTELIAIARDSAVPHSRRGRAVSALAHYPSPEVRTFLDAQLVGSDGYLQRKATGAIVRAFRDDALPSVEPLLASEDRQLRLAAVNAVGALGSPRAREILSAHAASESDDTVKEALTTALAEGSK